MRLFANANFDFIRRRRMAYVASVAVLGLTLVMALYWQFSRGSWLNYGVDFTGGTLVQVRFDAPTSVGALRDLVAPIAPGTEITGFGAQNEYLIRAPTFSEEGANISDLILSRLEGEYGAGSIEVVRTEAVGPKVGGELQQKAVFAVLLSFLATLIYLAFRFEWRFGLAAVIATGHDILITLGIISAFQLEFSLTTVAAVLTIVGYSLNDTIIVFDRARENLKRSGRRESFIDILNRSINETLPRTTLTAGTTLATLAALIVLGGSTIRGFALVMFLGILIGTWSSIFVASPALLEIEQRWKREPAKPRSSRPRRAGAGV